MDELKWTMRFKKLRRKGFTDEQLKEVFNMLSEAKVFRYAWLEVSAREQIQAMGVQL